jgi:hypothetical protein
MVALSSHCAFGIILEIDRWDEGVQSLPTVPNIEYRGDIRLGRQCRQQNRAFKESMTSNETTANSHFALRNHTTASAILYRCTIVIQSTVDSGIWPHYITVHPQCQSAAFTIHLHRQTNPRQLCQDIYCQHRHQPDITSQVEPFKTQSYGKPASELKQAQFLPTLKMNGFPINSPLLRKSLYPHPGRTTLTFTPHDPLCLLCWRSPLHEP